MLKRLLQPRWLTAIVIVLLAGFAVVYFAGIGIEGSSAATPKKGAQTGARIENLHQRTASRTKGDDPDDRPAFLSPEQAVTIALKALPANPVKPSVAPAGVAALAGATPSTSTAAVDAVSRKVDHKVVQGTAVFAVMVGTTEVDVDRQTGKVVSIHAAGK